MTNELDKAALEEAMQAYNAIYLDHSQDCTFEQCMAAAITAYQANAKPKETEGWRDISSAPKDGTHILLSGTYQWDDYIDRQETGIVVGFWEKDPWFLEGIDDEADRNDTGWVLANANPYTDQMQPTHWMPLPTPPTKGGE